MRQPLSRVVIIRVESALREALSQEAASTGLSLSEIARRELRAALASRVASPAAVGA